MIMNENFLFFGTEFNQDEIEKEKKDWSKFWP